MPSTPPLTSAHYIAGVLDEESLHQIINEAAENP